MTEMFSQYDQRQQAQSASGCFVTHSARLFKLLCSGWTWRKGSLVRASAIRHSLFINVSHYVSELGHTTCGESILVILSRFLGMDGWMDG